MGWGADLLQMPPFSDSEPMNWSTQLVIEAAYPIRESEKLDSPAFISGMDEKAEDIKVCGGWRSFMSRAGGG